MNWIYLFGAVAYMLVAVSCDTLKKDSSEVTDQSALMKVQLGWSKEELTNYLGQPAEFNTEEYGSSKFQVLEYNDASGSPVGFITIGPDKKVAAKAKWVTSRDGDYELESLLKGRFKNIQFKSYVPCETSGLKKFLVAQSEGVFIGTQNSKVIFVSFGNPQITDLRVSQFTRKCPSLQDSAHAQ